MSSYTLLVTLAPLFAALARNFLTPSGAPVMPEPVVVPPPPSEGTRTVGDSLAAILQSLALKDHEEGIALAAYEAELTRIAAVHKTVSEQFRADLLASGPVHWENPEGGGITFILAPEKPAGYSRIKTVAHTTPLPAPAGGSS